MILAAVHVSPWVTVPAAASLVCALAWYWLHLGRTDVPAGRRRIRRLSLLLALAALAATVVGMSFVDSAVHQTGYVVAWALVLLCVLAIMLAAAVDVFVSLSIQRELRTRLEIDAAVELHRAIKDRRSTEHRSGKATTTANGTSHNGVH